MRYFVDSYGCTMNQGEGRQLSARLASLGHEAVDNASEAELVVLNTCTVVASTERRMLRILADLEASGKKVLVTGCMAKVQPLLLQKRSPTAMVLPPRDYDNLFNIIERVGDPLPSSPASLTESLPIAQGCLGSCNYCITRLARGTLCSRSLDELEREFNQLLDRGAKEIHLSAQDTACYGVDIGSSLPELLRRLLSRPGEYRIRIGMMNPDRAIPILDELLELMEDSRLYRFLHLPLQSGSDKVLAAMGRRYSVEEFLSLVSRAREAYPDISISTDIINGYPGEDDEDHRLSMEALRQIRAETVNVTRFSRRPGTPAFKMPNRPHGRVSKARSRETTELRFRIAEERNAEMMGEVVRALVNEEGKGDSTIARSGSYRPVVLEGSHALGKFLDLRIVGYAATHLLGEPLDAP